MKLLSILAFAALATAALPLSASAPNECVLTGAVGPSGQPIAPPCIATDMTRTVSGGNPYAATCPAVPAGAPPEVIRTACKPYYVLLMPDADGNLGLNPASGDTSPDVTVEYTLIWQENNNCVGLQRVGGAGCTGADKRVLL